MDFENCEWCAAFLDSCASREGVQHDEMVQNDTLTFCIKK